MSLSLARKAAEKRAMKEAKAPPAQTEPVTAPEGANEAQRAAIERSPAVTYLDVAEPSRSRLNASLDALLEAAHVAKRAAEYKAGRGSGKGDLARHRIGAGYVGIECDRALAFKFHKYPVEDRGGEVSDGELTMHAEYGHFTEDLMIKLFRFSGFTILTEDQNNPGEQIGWKDLWDTQINQYRVAGQIDGLITALPAVVPEALRNDLANLTGSIETPCIWESKKATAKKFRRFQKNGVRKADPKYYGQLILNMNALKIPQTLFTMVNLDSMKKYHELVVFDAREAQRLVDRVLKTIRTESPFEALKIAHSEDSIKCKFCDYKDKCWSQTD